MKKFVLFSLVFSVFPLSAQNQYSLSESSEQVIKDFIDSVSEKSVGKFYDVKHETQLAFSDTVYDAADSLRIQNAISMNEEIMTGTVFEENQKTVFGIYLSLVAGDSLDSLHFSTLKTIASLCPHDGGPAVFTARGLIATIDSTVYTDENCTDDEIAYRENNEDDKFANNDSPVKIILTTNNDIVAIRSELSSFKLEIYNSIGQLIVTEFIQTNNFILDLKSIPAGVLIFKFLDSDGNYESSEKFLKQ